MIVICECGQRLSVPPELSGKQGRCPHCKRMISIPARESQGGQVLKVKCPCGQVLSVPVQLAGKQGRCPHCKTVITIPPYDMPRIAHPSPSETPAVAQKSELKNSGDIGQAEDNTQKQDVPATMPNQTAWVLNPDTTFPLTFQTIDQATAAEVKRILDTGFQSAPSSYTRELAALIARKNLRCKQVDDYVTWAKQECLRKIEELKRASKQWNSASEMEREGLLAEFREEAIGSLDIVPNCDLDSLLECEPDYSAEDHLLIDQVGFKNLNVYIRHVGNPDKVHFVRADSHERGPFEKLAEFGVATRGKDMPLPLMLDTLTLKEMNELVADLNQPAFTRKAKAMEFIMALPDKEKTLGHRIDIRDFFQLKPLPSTFSGVELLRISSAWTYACEVASLIAHTYRAATSISEWNSMGDDPFLVGWDLATVGDDRTCPYCERASKKQYSKNNCPKTPLHIGCRCIVVARQKFA